MSKESETKSDSAVNPFTAEVRCSLMLLGRRADRVGKTKEEQQNEPSKQRLTVAFLRRMVLRPSDSDQNDTADDDKDFLACTSVRLDSCNIHAIENLEMMDKLEHVHLQNNYIRVIEELDFVRNLTWLNLSRNNIEKIENLSHLKKLTCLDLSANNIVNVDDLSKQLPAKVLKIFCLYGNPVSTNDSEYRSKVTSSLPHLIAFDGTSLSNTPEEAIGFSTDDELYGCDGKNCNARVIFGPRFVTGVGTNEERDYCISCAYNAVSRNKHLDGHGYVLSTDTEETFNAKLATDASGGVQRSRTKDPNALLRRTALEARVELRNQREKIMMKIRQRRAQTSLAAEQRMVDQKKLLARLDQHLASKKKEGKTMEVEEVGNDDDEGKSGDVESSFRK
jgi:Leucine-rich repeat (LRR) protein